VTLAALAATLALYRAGRATTDIPVWRMIAVTAATLGARADAFVAALPEATRGRVAVSEMTSAIGGGSLPGETLESVGLVIAGTGGAAIAARLRAGDPAVVGRLEHGAVLLDLRTVAPDDDAVLVAAVARALART
jgi:L-seryl-tRNA(Ser) seleniumtransferase